MKLLVGKRDRLLSVWFGVQQSSQSSSVLVMDAARGTLLNGYDLQSFDYPLKHPNQFEKSITKEGY